ncbi:MAG: carboxylesterase family protein [Proteobacteria bacterium]|nr:carboxylesterase family protein [Pseudomonadota bacterium]
MMLRRLDRRSRGRGGSAATRGARGPRTLPLALLTLLLAPACSGSAAPATPPDADRARDAGGDRSATTAMALTGSGPLRGSVVGGSRVFLGIPFAAPPSGERRWAPPEPPAPWTEPRDARRLGASCLQTVLPSDRLPGPFSEDCLTLNVWAPNPQPALPAPVMVWIHGGGFFSGGSASPFLDGQRLAERGGAVVVSFNYRLGQLGFLAHPSLPAPGANWGLLDQQAALRWVRDNIAAFGGDPTRITIFGASAGGDAVCLQTFMPSSRGLFQRIIIQSGACIHPGAGGDGDYDLATGRAQADALVAALGCDAASDVLGCLRARPGAQVMQALPTEVSTVVVPGRRWGPVVDGSALPASPTDAARSADLGALTAIVGSNGDEGTIFALLAGYWGANAASYTEVVERRVGSENAAAVLARYPAEAFQAPRDAISTLVGDAVFVCGVRRTARALVAAGATVYGYAFMRAPDDVRLVTLPLGAYHGAEVFFLFDRPEGYGTFTAGERALAEQMAGYWTRFARDGAPGGDQPAWPRFTAAGDELLRLDLEPTTISAWKRAECDFWDSL